MAELSQETQAIISRLKAEGDLIRNSGTNSVRSVKIQLDRFEGIFNTISANVVEQTELMRLQVGALAEQVERQQTQEQFDEIEKAAPKPVENEDDNSSDSKDTNKKIDKIGDSIGKALTLKNMAMAGAGLFVGYNLLKGFINETTDGGFDRMITSIRDTDFTVLKDGINGVKWDEVKTTVNAMATGLSAVNWTNFGTAVNNATNSINSFTTWLGETGVGDIVSTVVAGGLVTAGARGAAQGIMGSLRQGGGAGAGFAGKLKAIGPGIAMAAAGLAIYYGDDIKNWINDQMGNEEGSSGSDLVNQQVDIATMGLSAMSIAMYFGPKAMIATAAVTAAVMLGAAIHKWVKDFKVAETEKFNAQVDAALKAAQEEDPNNLSADTAQQISEALVEARRRTQLAIGNAAQQEAEKSKAALEELLAAQELGDGTNGVNALQLNRIRQQILGGDMSGVDELFNFAEGRERETADNWFRFSSKEDFIRDMIMSLGDNAFGDKSLTQEQQLQQYNAWQDAAERILQERSYSKGTGGFKDFGAGTVSILHGHEAVVPLNSPEGQILKNLYNGPTPADVVAGNGSGGFGTTIINAPTIAPSNVSVNNAGSRVNQTSITGGGMGTGGSNLPYGLTGAFS